jgi:hypothetical protein
MAVAAIGSSTTNFEKNAFTLQHKMKQKIFYKHGVTLEIDPMSPLL